MRILDKMKDNKAVTLTDVIIGMVILILFTGIFTTSFYNIYKHNASIKLDAVAMYYSVQILENIDKMTYDEVTDALNTTLKDDYEIPEGFNASIEVKKYNEDDDTKEDVIKIVTININYEFLKDTKTYTVKKLKIREM